ncbi:EAL domain-containing response regulator [Aromatoleum evansii]|uniref:EAL domain-containing response regulator n=1 Tax=Aromatoleum evansii TaxID=59406 RepID=A0ABZ1AUB4_AROEV|nr:EAL domain-containing response regulator [Aromatoleum evansii]NMG31846.1 EAL domain-containing protein [Aromatoleum evansii]WRL48576.1 EAL domain-containing response regulator [Aromatoleum evansii]
MNILVIDDETFVRKLLVHQLGRMGFERVQACASAREALSLLEEGSAKPELIFCDLQMPEMDGVEFVRHLVRVGYEGGLVLVSGEDERVVQTAAKLARAHKLKVLGALSKPVSIETLKRILADDQAQSPAQGSKERKTYSAERLRRAIADGELVNHYQPKVEFASGAVAGFETLVRWRHPQDGLIPPDQFIPLAEESGLINELTRSVLRTALRHARAWGDDGYPLQVAVNVSMDNLVSLDFPDFVERALGEAGIAASGLLLEVTESRLMKDPLTPLEVLARLRLKRVGLSIDDFGTGHSSLAQLRDIPFSELKIDRGFVHGAWRDASLRAILEASLGMARQLGMKTVAEGVEDREDWDFLRIRGCELAQGWFIAKALPPEQIADWIADWEVRRPTVVEFRA